MTATVPGELFGPGFTRDPYPTYAWLREHSPVHRFELPQGMPAWLISRHTDVRRLLADPRLVKDLEQYLPAEALPGPHVRDVLTRNMLASDPPSHTRLRRLAARAFTARRVHDLRPMRFAAEDIEVGGVPIPRGGIVFLGLGSAGRDLVGDGEVFDIRRPTSGHLAFGHGIHTCIGSALARAESEVALGRLLDRYAELSLAVPVEELVWRPGMHFRGPAALPVTYRARTR